MRIRDYGITVGELPTGKLNKISDVDGVTVGHSTVINERHNTGVTVVMPCKDNMFAKKLPCASFVLNGFGKTAGLVQIDELGTLESPIALTNTLNVGMVHHAVTEYMIKRCKEDNVPIYSFNPIVCECNDASLNDIQDRAVMPVHVYEAIENACADFEEGAVGCGRGMTCHGLKGGVGSASRIIEIGKNKYTFGVLVQSNHGRLADLTVNGKNIGKDIAERIEENKLDKGSCIVILATDAPVSDRQLKRIIKRCSVGLARLGSFIGHGSGEVFIGFSTANRYPDIREKSDVLSYEMISENKIDLCFRAAAECTEEAILNSLAAAEKVSGYSGKVRLPLSDFSDLI